MDIFGDDLRSVVFRNNIVSFIVYISQFTFVFTFFHYNINYVNSILSGVNIAKKKYFMQAFFSRNSF